MSNNLYPQFDDLSDIDFPENENDIDFPENENGNINQINKSSESSVIYNTNEDDNKYEQIFEMFPNIEKELIIELFNEMKFDDLLDLLIQLDDNNVDKSSIENEYSDSSLSFVGCENVPRRRESIIQTIRNRLRNKNTENNDLEGYVELSQYDNDN